jgi:DNA-directed RNA polymerase beta subunit
MRKMILQIITMDNNNSNPNTEFDDSEFHWERDTICIADNHFYNNSFVQNQLNSFDYFIRHLLPMRLKRDPISVTNSTNTRKLTLRFVKVSVSRPTIFRNRQGAVPLLPMEARNSDHTYSSPVICDIEIEDESGSSVSTCMETQINLCHIPTMVGSCICHLHGLSQESLWSLGECPLDKGGYFIVNGSEKVIVGRERPSDNRLFAFPENDASKPYIARTEVKSAIDQRFFSIQACSVKLSRNFHVHVFLPYKRNPVPLGILLIALGVGSQKELYDYLVDERDGEEYMWIVGKVVDELMEHSHYGVMTQADALNYVANSINITVAPETKSATPDHHRMTQAADMLNRTLLPHLGNNPLSKIWYLVYMTRNLIRSYSDSGSRFYTDRDSLLNKRVDLSGQLLSQIFSAGYIRMVSDIKQKFNHIFSNEHGSAHNNNTVGWSSDVRQTIQRSGVATSQKMTQALSTGNWTTGRNQPANNTANKGVAQVLNRLNYLGTLSHLRRVNSPLAQAGSKHEPPRRLHSTQINKICPCETPEGAQVGVVKNLAQLTHVTIDTSYYPALFCLKKLGLLPIEEVSREQFHTMHKVLINGVLAGLIESDKKASRICGDLRHLKTVGVLNKYISICWNYDDRELNIQTDGGRYMVPYYRVDEDGHLIIEKWYRAFKKLKGNVKFPYDLNSLSDALPEELEPYIEKEQPYNARKVEYHTWKQAAVEWLDVYEDMSMMYASDYKNLWYFTTFKKNKNTGYYEGNLTPSVDLTRDSVEQNIQSQNIRVNHFKVLDAKRRLVSIKLESDNLPENSVVYHNVNLNRLLSSRYITYTHLLIHPSFVNGVVAANIPFSNHNPSPRNCYQSSMGKQALGIPCTNYHLRMDTTAHVLLYPQRPLLSTMSAKYTGLAYLHHGCIPMVARATYSGHNQEDSLINSLSASQRGYYASAFYRTVSAKKRSTDDNFKVPPAENTLERKVGVAGRDRYHAIDVNTLDIELPRLGTVVVGGDVVIPRSQKVKREVGNESMTYYTDASITVRASEGGVIDLVIPNPKHMEHEDSDGHQFIKVRTCDLRIPEIGDKFASRAAQKGTVGIQFNAGDMICSQDSVCPILIMNPHGIPSRMTNGHLLDEQLAQYAALTGRFLDCTSFTNLHHQEIIQLMEQSGYDAYGENYGYNGMTGAMIGVVTILPTYYQRLRHMVADKMHARNTGPVVALTKQPSEGRARDGGLRIGEMERDALIAHGVSNFIRERLADSSDLYSFHVSKEKKDFVTANPQKGIYQYGTQNVAGDDIREVHMPYAMHLLISELKQMGISTHLEIGD